MPPRWQKRAEHHAKGTGALCGSHAPLCSPAHLCGAAKAGWHRSGWPVRLACSGQRCSDMLPHPVAGAECVARRKPCGESLARTPASPPAPATAAAPSPFAIFICWGDAPSSGGAGDGRE